MMMNQGLVALMNAAADYKLGILTCCALKIVNTMLAFTNNT
jgi:hypothetical protein